MIMNDTEKDETTRLCWTTWKNIAHLIIPSLCSSKKFLVEKFFQSSSVVACVPVKHSEWMRANTDSCPATSLSGDQVGGGRIKTGGVIHWVVGLAVNENRESWGFGHVGLPVLLTLLAQGLMRLPLPCNNGPRGHIF